MSAVTDLFLFNGASFITMLLRFFVLASIAGVLLFLVNFTWLRFYKKETEPQFLLYADRTFLYSITFVSFLLSVEWYFLININGIHWFRWAEFPLSVLNIYFLLLPEIFVLGSLFILFFVCKSKIKKNL